MSLLVAFTGLTTGGMLVTYVSNLTVGSVAIFTLVDYVVIDGAFFETVAKSL